MVFFVYSDINQKLLPDRKKINKKIFEKKKLRYSEFKIGCRQSICDKQDTSLRNNNHRENMSNLSINILIRFIFRIIMQHASHNELKLRPFIHLRTKHF